MSDLAQLRRMRENWVQANRENKFEEGILNLLTELYPDNAHFIYELLQNAEDAQASKVTFLLDKDSFVCRHNGKRKFTEQNVEAITSIGKSTKRDDVNQIGKFGVGFKAVFSYTTCPRVYSGDFAFEIRDLVCPVEIAPMPALGDDTVFEFPFDKPGKPANTAFDEVRQGLDELSETTLLFLSNIEQICWEIIGGETAVITRFAPSPLHYEIEYLRNGRERRTLEWLKLSDQVEGLPHHHVSLAFAMEPLEKTSSGSANMDRLSDRYKIVRTNGQVSIYFPAEKETSKLRFHIHAPFASTVARDSIRTRRENEPLMAQLAKLLRRSLHVIRDEGLLTTEYLEVLPLPDDELSVFYKPLLDAVLDEMRAHPLTPTNHKRHAPACRLVQGSSALKELLNQDDLNFMLGTAGDSSVVWAANALRNSRAERLLRALQIRELENEKFANLIAVKASPKLTFTKNPTTGNLEKSLNGQFGVSADSIRATLWGWFDAHDDSWMQQLYCALYEFTSQKYPHLRSWSDVPIVKVSDGRYLSATKTYFPADGVEEDEVFPRVRVSVFSSGKSDSQKAAAKSFLTGIGVQEVGPREDVERILRTRYSRESTFPSFETHLKDMELFLKYWEEEPYKADLFSNFLIFSSEDEKFWCPPVGVYLDEPYLETGLLHIYGSSAIGKDRIIFGLSRRYHEYAKLAKRLVAFAKAVGVVHRLVIQQVTTALHPHSGELRVDWLKRGAQKRDTGRDEDFMIEGLEKWLATPSAGVSKAIWMTMRGADKDVLEARFQANRSQPLRRQPSSLVLKLRELSWVPLKDGTMATPAKTTERTLAQGFPVDNTNGWLTAVGFGDEERRENESYRQKENEVISDGFANLEEYETVTEILRQIPESERKQVLEELRARCSNQRPDEQTFPERPVRNAELRTSRVKQRAEETPEKETTRATRGVQVGYQDVKAQARDYLQEQYTNEFGVMFCQICKKELPFKVENGEYYFEAIEVIEDLPKRFREGYLSLCPNHAAMYRFANGDKDRGRSMVEVAVGREMELTLAGNQQAILFTETHLADLKASLQSLADAGSGIKEPSGP
ncbi:hypothetical protein LMG23992_00349 [Cupriavidus laharis]|uniref:Sacsin/Nov domain-containing protein n=1 Tax=Cupriavidus laharis TaxID=151654 RepID=A0ABM8WD21_9BURK|nr:hypothetical protein [Cupriavidus laharis]CAG9165205.1 hypothetical protein LMG23992_00349 [Cupriavidus laharis]